jgi:hypothetical protein
MKLLSLSLQVGVEMKLPSLSLPLLAKKGLRVILLYSRSW